MEEAPRARLVFPFQDRGLAAVAGAADFGVEFDAAEEGGDELLGRLFRSAFGEDIDFVIAMRADEVTHVFDDTDHVHFDLAEHFDGFAGVLHSDVGGRGDDDRPG